MLACMQIQRKHLLTVNLCIKISCSGFFQKADVKNYTLLQIKFSSENSLNLL